MSAGALSVPVDRPAHSQRRHASTSGRSLLTARSSTGIRAGGSLRAKQSS